MSKSSSTGNRSVCVCLQSKFPARWSLSERWLFLQPPFRLAGSHPAFRTAPSWATGCCGPRARRARSRWAPSPMVYDALDSLSHCFGVHLTLFGCLLNVINTLCLCSECGGEWTKLQDGGTKQVHRVHSSSFGHQSLWTRDCLRCRQCHHPIRWWAVS